MVVLTSECLSNSCTVRIPVPDRNKYVVKLCHKVYADAARH